MQKHYEGGLVRRQLKGACLGPARAGEHWQNPADCGVRCQQYQHVYWCDPAGRPAAINLTVGSGYQRASGQDCQL